MSRCIGALECRLTEVIRPQPQHGSVASPRLQKLTYPVLLVIKLNTRLTKVTCQVISQTGGEAMAGLVEIWSEASGSIRLGRVLDVFPDVSDEVKCLHRRNKLTSLDMKCTAACHSETLRTQH